MLTFKEVVSCPDSAVYFYNNSKMQVIGQGQAVLLDSNNGMLMLKLQAFQYGVNPHLEVQYDDKDPESAMTFYLSSHSEGEIIIKIKQNADKVYEYLSRNCYLTNRNSTNQYPDLPHNKTQQYQPMPINQPQNQGKQPSQKNTLVGYSEGINHGLTYVGNVIAKKIDYYGDKYSKKVEPSKNIQISNKNMGRIDTAQNTSGRILQFTVSQVEKLFGFGKRQILGNGQKGKGGEQHKYHDKVRDGAVTSLEIFLNLYEGAMNAVEEVGGATLKGGTKVIGAKYGKDSEKASNGIVDAVLTLAKIRKVPQDVALKEAKEIHQNYKK